MSHETMVPAVIDYKFDAYDFDDLDYDEPYHSPALDVVHKGVKLSFGLGLYPNQSDPNCSNSIGVFVSYNDGPKENVKVNYYVYVIKSSKQTPCKLLSENLGHPEFYRDTNWCEWRTLLPRNPHTLATQKFLHDQDSKLHITALLLIPESAFNDNTYEDRYTVLPPSPVKVRVKEIIEKTTVLVNPVFDALFKQIKEPIDDTTSPHNFGRFDFISSDDEHFYVHKDILSASSEPFKQMFEPKPEDAQFAYIKEGCMKLENLNAGALNESFSYIYLAKTTPEFSKFALNIVEGANMYGLNGLMSLCEQEIIKQTKQMDRSAAFECLQMSQRHNLTALIKASASALHSRLIVSTDSLPEDFLIDIFVFSKTHGHTNLRQICEIQLFRKVDPSNKELTADQVLKFASTACKHDIDYLLQKCGQWFTKNWDQVMANGLRAFVEDNTDDGVLTRVLGCALSNKS